MGDGVVGWIAFSPPTNLSFTSWHDTRGEYVRAVYQLLLDCINVSLAKDWRLVEEQPLCQAFH